MHYNSHLFQCIAFYLISKALHSRSPNFTSLFNAAWEKIHRVENLDLGHPNILKGPNSTDSSRRTLETPLQSRGVGAYSDKHASSWERRGRRGRLANEALRIDIRYSLRSGAAFWFPKRAILKPRWSFTWQRGQCWPFVALEHLFCDHWRFPIAFATSFLAHGGPCNHALVAKKAPRAEGVLKRVCIVQVAYESRGGSRARSLYATPPSPPPPPRFLKHSGAGSAPNNCP